MAWIRNRRAYLIGTGAIVVALVAIGIVLHEDKSSMHKRAFFEVHGRFFDRPIGPGGYGVGPRGFAQQAPGLEGIGPMDSGPRFAIPAPPPGVGPFRPELREGSDAGLLHGEFTVKGARGGYQTVEVQRGTVTKVSARSITVKSPDGYTATYAVNSKTPKAKTGDDVQVRAIKSGNKLTVTRLSNSHESTSRKHLAR